MGATTARAQLETGPFAGGHRVQQDKRPRDMEHREQKRRGEPRLPSSDLGTSSDSAPNRLRRSWHGAWRGAVGWGWLGIRVGLWAAVAGCTFGVVAAVDPAVDIALDPGTRAPQVGILGSPGKVYRLEYTEGLQAATVWQVLSNVTLSASSALVVDRDAVGRPARFYRTAESSDPVDPSLLLWLKFEGGLQGVGGETPLSQQGVSYRAGKVGQGLYVGATGHVRYPVASNLNPGEGTIECWVQPDWNGTNQDVRVFFEVGDNFDNGMLLSKDGIGNLRFLQWGDDPSTPAVEKTVERGLGFGGQDWVRGQWYHLAATWNGATRELAFYLNGEVLRTATNGVVLRQFSTTYLVIGAEIDSTRAAVATMDDLRIYNRARTAAEIWQDYQNPVGVRSSGGEGW